MAIKGFVSRTSAFLFLASTAVAQTCWKNITCSGPLDTAFPGSWESNIYAPASRTVSPKSIISIQNGQVLSSYSGTQKISGNGTNLVLDFSIEVGGLVTLNYTTTGAGQIGLAFTEGKNWIGEWSDGSNGDFTPDGAIYSNFTSAGTYGYTQPDIKLRGGFRYLTLFLITNGTTEVTIKDITLDIGFSPTWSNLRAYQGYFNSNDDTLNKIWYSGAYTLQTNAVPVDYGRTIGVKNTWENAGVLGPGDSIIVDGAKRDRAVWPGDMGIAVPSTFVSIGDLVPVKNGLQTMYNNQNPTTGAFPEAGPPLLQLGSDTYHMWTMIGTYNYLLYSNDTAFLQENWAKYLLAMTYIYGKVTYTSGLLNVTGLRDWARWQTGYNGSEPQMILYRTLLTGADLATWAEDKTNLTTLWTNRAAALKIAINEYCYDGAYGAFKDNATATTLHPQDANSMSILFGAVNSTARAESISTNLLKNWTPIGAETPELPGNISPFISSFEIQAHFTIGQTARALELIRRSWGWYLNNANGTESTVIEGYLINGTFGYRSTRGYDYDTSYISHSHGWSSGPTSALTEFVLGLSHGWSSGPTSALTEFVLGLSVTSPAGATWKLAPQFGDLTTVEGGFVTSLGKYQASWATNGRGYTLSYSVPEGTTGVLELPCLDAGKFPSIQIDKKDVPGSYNPRISKSGKKVLLNVESGSHQVVVG